MLRIESIHNIDEINGASAGLQEGIARIVESTTLLPPDYYAHANARHLLGMAAPELASELTTIRHSEAMLATAHVMAEFVDDRRNGLQPDEVRIGRQVIAAMVYANGFSASELSHVPGFAEAGLSRRTLQIFIRRQWSPKYRDIVADVIQESPQPVFAGIGEWLNSMPVELQSNLQTHLSKQSDRTRASGPQRQLLKALFPDHHSEIDGLRYRDLRPLLWHMVGAFITAQAIHKSRTDYTDAIATADRFIDRFFSTSLLDIASRREEHDSTVSKSANVFINQLNAYDKCDLNDLFCLALNLPIVAAAPLRERQPPPLVTQRSRVDLVFDNFYGQARSPVARSRSDSVRPARRRSVLPARGSTPLSQGDDTVTPQMRTIDLLDRLAQQDMDKPLPEEVLQKIGELSASRFQLTQAERRLLDDVRTPVRLPDKNSELVPSLEMVSRRPAYRELAAEDFRQRLISTVCKMAAITARREAQS